MLSSLQLSTKRSTCPKLFRLNRLLTKRNWLKCRNRFVRYLHIRLLNIFLSSSSLVAWRGYVANVRLEKREAIDNLSRVCSINFLFLFLPAPFLFLTLSKLKCTRLTPSRVLSNDCTVRYLRCPERSSCFT